MKKEIKVGVCKYCGQIRNVETNIEADQKEIDRLATMECNCEMARAYQESANRIEKADQKVDVLFGYMAPSPASEKVIEILKLSIRACEAESMKAISINIDGSTKAKVSKTSKNTIKVERVDTTVQTLED